MLLKEGLDNRPTIDGGFLYIILLFWIFLIQSLGWSLLSIHIVDFYII